VVPHNCCVMALLDIDTAMRSESPKLRSVPQYRRTRRRYWLRSTSRRRPGRSVCFVVSRWLAPFPLRVAFFRTSKSSCPHRATCTLATTAETALVWA
jgi:hypothetical protein